MLQYNDVNNNLGDCKSDKINKDSILSKKYQNFIEKMLEKNGNNQDYKSIAIIKKFQAVTNG